MTNIKIINDSIAIVDNGELRIDDCTSFLEIVHSIAHDTIVLYKENFPEKFYDLKSGFAGEILQRVANYNLRLIVLGNFSNYNSKNFKDFVYESNKKGKVIFVDKLESGIELLK